MDQDLNSPATKKDLADLDRRLDDRFKHFDRSIDERLMRMQDDLVDKMRDMQTEVLRAFHNWARQ